MAYNKFNARDSPILGGFLSEELRSFSSVCCMISLPIMAITFYARYMNRTTVQKDSNLMKSEYEMNDLLHSVLIIDFVG